MKTLIVANWKCNPTTLAEAKWLFDSVKKGVKKIKKAEVVVCPPSIYLSELKSQDSTLKIGAQNCFWEKEGAYTGEISALMLKNIGCQYIIVGHSERRKYFNETDEIVNKKLKSVLDAGLLPILCIGETKKERDQGKTDKVLKKQIETDLKGIKNLKATLRGVRFASSKIKNLILAYEPIWAIGSGKPCDVEEAQKAGLLIKKIISNLFNIKIAEKIQILYGGSVNSKNAEGYIKEAGLDGLLVGGASLKSNEFVRIVKSVLN